MPTGNDIVVNTTGRVLLQMAGVDTAKGSIVAMYYFCTHTNIRRWCVLRRSWAKAPSAEAVSLRVARATSITPSQYNDAVGDGRR